MRAVPLALRLLLEADAETLGIIALSIRVSLTASLLAVGIGVPCAALLAIARIPGRRAVLVLVNAALGLPPVVIGLLVYLLLSRSGPLGGLGWLFSPAAMIVAQTLLALPIAVALAHRALAPLWLQHGDALRVDGAGPLQLLHHLVRMARGALLTVFLAAFGRCIAEVGAILLVGGNIRHHTRTMTTAIALETSKGDLPLAIALGIVLLAICVTVSWLTLALERRAAV